MDPNFRKTVVFISNHDSEEGSFGLILNRSAQRTVAQMLPDQTLGALGGVPVLLGGPVGSDQLIFASFLWHMETEHMECRHHLGIEQAREALDAERTTVRAFIGCAGWTKGQLEEELSQHSWLIAKPDMNLFVPQRCEKLWQNTLGGFGPWFRLVGEAPDDLSRN